MLDNIPRISAPSPEHFEREFLRVKRPVVIRDLFDGQAIAALDSEAKARAELGTMPVEVHAGYEHYFTQVVSALASGASFDGESDAEMDRRPSTLSEYLDAAASDPSARQIASEVPEQMTPGLNSLYQLPPYCARGAGGREDTRVETWIANGGNYSHLHFDADQRHVLQYQVFGLKRVVMLPPSAGDRIGAIRNNCVLSPEGVPEAEQDAFIESLGGYQCQLGPGDAIFLPALMWHYFEYQQTSMAITMRFCRNRYARFFGDNLHFDYRLQELSWLFLDEDAVGPRLEHAYQQIQEAFESAAPSPQHKGQRVQAVIEELHEELCLPHHPGRYSRAFLEPLRDAVRALEIETRDLYI